MKAILVLLILPLAWAATDPSEKLFNQIKSLAHEAVDSIASTPYIQPVVGGTPRANVYDLIFGLIRTKLLVSDIVVNAGNETSSLQIVGGLIQGMEEAILATDYPPSGFDLNNLTFYVPNLNVVADQYVARALDLGILKLNGEGPLTITISDLRVYTKMEIKYKSSKLVVQKIPIMTLHMGGATINLENLGGSGDRMSELLNGIATKALPKLIEEFDVTVQQAITASEGDCKHQDLETICALISTLLTNLKNNIV